MESLVCLRKEYEHLTDMRVEFFRSNGAFFLMTIMFVQDRRHVAFSFPHELYDFFSITPFLQLKMEAFSIDTLEFSLRSQQPNIGSVSVSTSVVTCNSSI